MQYINCITILNNLNNFKIVPPLIQLFFPQQRRVPLKIVCICAVALIAQMFVCCAGINTLRASRHTVKAKSNEWENKEKTTLSWRWRKGYVRATKDQKSEKKATFHYTSDCRGRYVYLICL